MNTPIEMSTYEVIIKDKGHDYILPSLDGDAPQRLSFVKRHDESDPTRFPGNTDSHPGTTSQAVMHALIERRDYVQNQKPHPNNLTARQRMVEVLWLDEERAALNHGYVFDLPLEGFENRPMCGHCGHVICEKLGNAKKIFPQTPAPSTEEE